MHGKTSIAVSAKQNAPHLFNQFFSILSKNMSDGLQCIHAMFWNIAFLTAVTYFFALLSVGRARYLCI
jgi:hypothetical protein